jgi:hypothetical protein
MMHHSRCKYSHLLLSQTLSNVYAKLYLSACMNNLFCHRCHVFKGESHIFCSQSRGQIFHHLLSDRVIVYHCICNIFASSCPSSNWSPIHDLSLNPFSKVHASHDVSLSMCIAPSFLEVNYRAQTYFIFFEDVFYVSRLWLAFRTLLLQA